MQQETITVLLKNSVHLLDVFDGHAHLSVGSLALVISWESRLGRNECLRFLNQKESPLEKLSGDLLNKLLSSNLVDFAYAGDDSFEVKLEPQTGIHLEAQAAETAGDFPCLNSINIISPTTRSLEILTRDKIRVRANRSAVFFSALESPATHPLLFELLKRLNVITFNGPNRNWVAHDEFFHLQSRVIMNPVWEEIAGHQTGDSLCTQITLNSAATLPIPSGDFTQSPLVHALSRRRSERVHSGSAALSKSRLLELSAYLLPAGKRYFYPRAGGLNATRIYFYVRSSVDLRTGLYFLNPESRSLDLVSSEKLDTAFDLASLSWDHRNGVPQGLIFITGNYLSMQRKYPNIGYRNLLLEAGCVAQLIQIAAAEVGIKSCLLGSGSVDVLSQLTGVSPSQECQLVELAIGV